MFLSTHSFAHSYTHTDNLRIDLSTQLCSEQSKAILMNMSSKACVAKMTATGRLHCDVFGSLSSSKTDNRRKSSIKGKRTTVNSGKRNQSMSVAVNNGNFSCRSLNDTGDDWDSTDGAILEDLLEEGRRDSIIPRNRRSSLAGNRSSSTVLSRDTSGKRQQAMVDLLLDLDPA